eukprot:494482-Hanusia_phi.AAC.1
MAGPVKGSGWYEEGMHTLSVHRLQGEGGGEGYEGGYGYVAVVDGRFGDSSYSMWRCVEREEEGYSGCFANVLNRTVRPVNVPETQDPLGGCDLTARFLLQPEGVAISPFVIRITTNCPNLSCVNMMISIDTLLHEIERISISQPVTDVSVGIDLMLNRGCYLANLQLSTCDKPGQDTLILFSSDMAQELRVDTQINAVSVCRAAGSQICSESFHVPYYDAMLPDGGWGADVNPAQEDIVEIALRIHQRLWSFPHQEQFLLVAFGNREYVPFFQSWLCNTARMDGVHSRTMIITSDHEAYEKLSRFPHNATIVRSILKVDGEELPTAFEFQSLGFFLLTEHRNRVMEQLIDAGIDILLFEADAIWMRNPLQDVNLVYADADVVGFWNTGKIGFGWTLLRATRPTLKLWKELDRRYHEIIEKELGQQLGKYLGPVANEMDLLNHVLGEMTATKEIRLFTLDECDYVSGIWYDGGIEGDGAELRRRCHACGRVPYVVNNNFIVGIRGKQMRAKRWRHWFAEEDGSCYEGNKMQETWSLAEESFHLLQPQEKPRDDECPSCYIYNMQNQPSG